MSPTMQGPDAPDARPSPDVPPDASGNPLFDAILAGRERGDGRLLTLGPGDDARAVDDAEFLETSARYAAALVDIGVGPGDRVAVQVDKSVEALALYVASLRAGAVFLPLNTAYTESELGYFVADAAPAALVLAPENEAMGERLVKGTLARVLTLGTDGRGTLVELAARSEPMDGAVERTGADLAAILYTSGTTGRSKGAMLTHDNLLSNARTLVRAWAFRPEDVLVHALPIFHTHGLFVACNVTLLAGSRMIFLPGFDVDAVIDSLPRASVLMGVPTFYTRLLDDARFERALASGVRLFVSGSAPLLAATHRAFEERTGQRILERYGMTETNMNCSNPYDGERRAGTVGPSLPGVEVRVRDENGRALAAGEVGTLEVRGPNVFAGYWKMPEKTAEELLADGFFVTGDLATIDEAGYVTIVGRDKDLVISGGYNVYPKEVELALDALAGVAESAVVGAPHGDLGEAPVAFVVPEAGPDGSRLDETLVTEALRESLARFKRPRRVVFVDELPRNTMGKVQKAVLRERVADVFDG